MKDENPQAFPKMGPQEERAFNAMASAQEESCYILKRTPLQSGSPKAAEIPLIAGVPASERDWTEDFPHENGNYVCNCCECKQTFYGHKRRVVCKVCAAPRKDAGSAAAPTKLEIISVEGGGWRLLKNGAHHGYSIHREELEAKLRRYSLPPGSSEAQPERAALADEPSRDSTASAAHSTDDKRIGEIRELLTGSGPKSTYELFNAASDLLTALDRATEDALNQHDLWLQVRDHLSAAEAERDHEKLINASYSGTIARLSIELKAAEAQAKRMRAALKRIASENCGDIAYEYTEAELGVMRRDVAKEALTPARGKEEG